MKILYAKYNSHRRPPFRIVTTIVEEDGCYADGRYVEKRALTAEACGHIHSIRQGYECLQENLIDAGFKLPAILEAGDAFVRFAFIEGRSLGELLLQAVLEGDRPAFMDLLDVYYTRLRRSFRTIDHFRPAEETAPIFQDIPTALLDKEGPFSYYSFLDPIFENIVVQGDDWYIIDNEWVFDGSLPVSFPFFRSLLIFCKVKYGPLDVDALIPFEELLSRYGIPEELHKVYDLIEANFQRYVNGPELEVTLYKLPYRKNRESIVNFNPAVADRDGQIADLNQVVADRDGQIAALYQSYSWRITWPLRVVGHQLGCIIRRMGLQRRLAGLFGMMYWPDGEPKISQGFSGEEIQIPVANVDNPLISVVMPVYNACRSDKKHFHSALESIANQTYKNVELIIVDDGSTDDSRHVCEAFFSTRPDLRAYYYSKKNGGQSSARNFGVKACSGEYIAFIDQDDEWYNDKLEQVVPWLGDKRIDVLYTDADTIDTEGNVIHRRIHQSLFVGWPHPKKAVEDILFKDVFVMPGLMTIKKETLEKVGGFDENLSGYEDDDLFLRLFEKSRIFYLPVPTLRWRMYSDNYSLSHRMLASRSYYWEKLLKNYTDNGTNQIRVRMISLRFFWEFILQALAQYDVGNELYRRNIDGAREIVPHLPKPQRILFGFIFLLPLKYTMLTLVVARKALNVFR